MSFLPNPAASSQPSPLDPGWVPRCAVFDCDGVLMDTERQWVDSVATVAREYGLADPQGLAEGLTGMTAEQIAHRVAEAVAAERLRVGRRPPVPLPHREHARGTPAIRRGRPRRRWRRRSSPR